MSLSVLLVLLLYFIDIVIITIIIIIIIIIISIPADPAFWPAKFLTIKDSYPLYKGKVNINPRQKMFFPELWSPVLFKLGSD